MLNFANVRFKLYDQGHPMDPMSPMSGLGPGGHNGPDSPHGSGPGTPLGGTVPLGPPSHPDPALGFPGPAPRPQIFC